MMTNDALYVLVLLVGIAVGAALMKMNLEGPKLECEAALPRNVECAWSAPLGEHEK